MTSLSDLDPNSVKISTQTLGETIYQFVDLPGLPSIQERIIRTQDDQVKKALADLGWICPQEAKAAERVIADGAKGPTPDYTGEGSAWIPPKTKPHTFAQMVNEVRDLAFDFGTSEQFRDRVADLLGKYIPVEHNSKGMPEQTEAQAVVVPDLEDGDDAWQDAAFKGVNYSAGLRDGYNLAKSRACAIPADRVLGDGEVKMEICERDCREDDEDALEVLRVCGYGQQAEMLEAAIKAHDLRANQGGAAT